MGRNCVLCDVEAEVLNKLLYCRTQTFEALATEQYVCPEVRISVHS